MPGRRDVLAAALVAAALTASGCGASARDAAGGFGGQAKGVATTLDDLQRLGRKRDGNAICSTLLSAALVDAIKKKAGSTSCPSAVEDVLKDVDSFDLKPDGKDAISVRGATAMARVISGSGRHKRGDRLALVREAGRWKLSTLGA